MKYLSFDIECCDGQHICEFGYVLIDERFNVLERDCITINPEYKFNLTGRKKERDISLAFPEEVYYDSPKFDYYYERIKKILTIPNCQIIGFSLKNDAGFLATACKLYGKEMIHFVYDDFQQLYQGYTKAKNRTSVEGFVEELQISDIKLHKSDNDAWAVIRALQIIGENEKLSLPQTLIMLKKRNKSYRSEKTKEQYFSLIEKLNNGNQKSQNEFLKRFIQGLNISRDKKCDLLFGKKVCISSHFQKKRFNEFLAIIERLYEYGATYTGKASVCDIFIEYNEGEEEIRAACVKKSIEDYDKAIQILSLEDVLKALDLTIEELNKVDHINGSLYEKIEKEKNEKGKIHNFFDKAYNSATVSDILKAKGMVK
ncbi:MAG: hypothetical protein IJ706_02855 [Clostridia bacterium]|nr:hypothetical protein [Clostridia bacterium]